MAAPNPPTPQPPQPPQAAATHRDRPGTEWLIDVAIGQVQGSRWVALASFSFTLVAALSATLRNESNAWIPVFAVAALALGMAQVYIALRCELDRRLFESLLTRMMRPDIALAGLDEALVTLGWLSPSRTNRSIGDRVRRLADLIRLQGWVTFIQAVLLALIPWLDRF